VLIFNDKLEITEMFSKYSRFPPESLSLNLKMAKRPSLHI